MTQMAIPTEPVILCQRCRSKPGIHNHHRQRRSQGGDDSPENLVLVCLDCHQWIHDNPRDAASAGWLVLSWQDPGEVEVEPFVEEVVHDHVDVAPGETCPVCHRRVPKPKEEQEAPRQKATISMKVPQDQRENGVELWYEMIQIGRDLLCERMGWEPNVPMYNVAMVLVAQGLEASRGEGDA